MARQVHNENENYLYFAKTGVVVDAASEAVMLPASAYLGCNPTSNTNTNFMFEDVLGTATATVVSLTHAAGTNKAVIDAMVSIMNSYNGAGALQVVADGELDDGSITGAATKAGTVFHKAFNGNVTACAAIA